MLLCVLLSLAVVWSIWSVPLVFSNDGPQAVLLAHIDAHYDDPGSIFPAQFDRGLGLSGRGFMFLYGPLEGLGWPTALRLCQVVMVLGFAWGAALLSRSLHGRFTYRSLAGFAIALNWPFYMGFYAFCVASGVTLWILALTTSRPKLSAIHKLGISVALLCALLCHPVMGTVGLGLVLLIVAARRWPERRTSGRAAVTDGLWLLLTSIPNMVVFALMGGAQTQLSNVADSEHAAWEPFATLLATLPRIAVPGSTLLGWLALTVGACGLVSALANSARLQKADVSALALGGAMLVLLAVFGPTHLPGWQFFSGRFLSLGLALGFCVLPEIASNPGRSVALVASLSGASLGIANARGLNVDLANACGGALAALEHQETHVGLSLPIVLDSQCGQPANPPSMRVPYLAPALHLSALFPVRQGGSVPYVFAGPAAVHVLVPRAIDVPVPPFDLWGFTPEHEQMRDPAARALVLDKLAVFGTAYEAVLVFGKTDADRAQLIERGLVVDFERGDFLSGRFQPCRVDVSFEVEPGDPPMQVVGGLRATERWPAEWLPIDGGARATFRGLCGKLWARVAWQDGLQRCSNADADGRIPVNASPGAGVTRVHCER